MDTQPHEHPTDDGVPDFDALDVQPPDAEEVVLEYLNERIAKEEADEQDIEVKVIPVPKVNQHSEPTTETNLVLKISSVELNSRSITSPTNQHVQVGFLVDMWGDLIDGYASKAHEFNRTFQDIFKSRNVTALQMKIDELQASGWGGAPVREMIFLRRDPVTVTLYLATQGDDLYVSWRAFIQRDVEENRVVALLWLWLGVAAFIIFIVSGGFNIVGFSETIIGAIGGGIVALIIGAIACFMGYTRHDGDYLHYFRTPINELHIDDILSATSVVHKTIIATADKMGIDIATLEAREPFYKQRRRPFI